MGCFRRSRCEPGSAQLDKRSTEKRRFGAPADCDVRLAKRDHARRLANRVHASAARSLDRDASGIQAKNLNHGGWDYSGVRGIYRPSDCATEPFGNYTAHRPTYTLKIH